MKGREHVFTMNLTPNGMSSAILLDGEDISGILRGVQVLCGVDQPTTVKLFPAPGHRAELIARLPEAHIVIETEQEPT